MNIYKSEKNLNQIIDTCSKLKADFLEELKTFTIEWYSENLNFYFNLFPEIKDTKSNSEIAQLIKKSRILSNEAASDLVKLFANDKIWWHTNQTINAPNYYKDINTFAPQEYKFIFGRLGNLLNEYDFLPIMVKPFQGFATIKDSGNLYKFEYINPIHWSRNLKIIADNYWEEYKWALKNLDSFKKSA